MIRALAIALLLIAAPAQARGPHEFDPQHFASQEEQKQYFKGLSSPGGGLCCDDADGKRLEDPDWSRSEGMKCQRFDADEVAGNDPGEYCVRLEGTWWAVPDSAIVSKPNKVGPAEVWPVLVPTGERQPDGTIGRRIIRVRCFLPGAGA